MGMKLIDTFQIIIGPLKHRHKAIILYYAQHIPHKAQKH